MRRLLFSQAMRRMLLMFNRYLVLSTISAAVMLTGCSDDPITNSAERASWTGTEYGNTPAELTELTPGGKADGVGTPGPQLSWDNDQYQVWQVDHQWDEVTSEEGLAWTANSGLTWNEKYVAWVENLPVIPHPTSEGLKTFELTTPHGKNIVAPVLECAEVAIFLRIAFASWHGLPFYMQASDGGRPVYIGHFGFRSASGASFANAPRFVSAIWTTDIRGPSGKLGRRMPSYGVAGCMVVATRSPSCRPSMASLPELAHILMRYSLTSGSVTSC